MNIDITTIFNDLTNQGYSLFDIPSLSYHGAVSLSKDFFALRPPQLLELSANKESGILGYYPATVDLKFTEENKKKHISYYYISPHNHLIDSNPIIGKLLQLSDHPVITNSLEDVYQTMSQLSQSIASNLYKKITNLDSTPFDEPNECLSLMRLLKYPFSNEPYQSKFHTDYEFITFIYTDQEGLEVRDKNGTWKTIKSSNNQIIILAGDMLEAISKGNILSPLHRVSNHKNTRYSTIFFQGLPMNYDIDYKIPGYKTAKNYGQHILPLLIKSAPHLKSSAPKILNNLDCSWVDKNPFKMAKL